MNPAYVSMGKSFLYSLINARKGVKNSLIDSPFEISRRASLSFSDDLLKRFNESTNWRQDDIAPTFPYVISTHIHFALVNDAHFPFSPYGLLHKKEEIITRKPLKKGNWEMHAYIKNYRKNSTGLDFDLNSDLYVDGVLSWKSKSTVYKKLTASKRKDKKSSNSLQGEKILSLVPNMARKYGLVSKNIDPIHMSYISAKIMGHKSSIMHGMWGLARALSDLQRFKEPYKISCTFISPMYLPCEVRIGLEEKDGIVEFGFYPKTGKKPYFLGKITAID